MLERIGAMGDIVTDELNVKRLALGEHETALATLKAKPNFRRLGPVLGPRMRDAARAIAALPGERIEELLAGGRVALDLPGGPVEIGADDVAVERHPREGMVVASSGDLIVALETELSDALLAEGLAREFVNKVQTMRKAAGLEVTQRIRIACAADGALASAIEAHKDSICGETLCVECRFAGSRPAGAEDWDVNGHPCAIALEPVRA
jgi:isoleucyl-tRNA synthetase